MEMDLFIPSFPELQRVFNLSPVTVLLIMGVLCLVGSYYSVPSKEGNYSVSLSLKTYIPLLKSKKLITFLGGVSFLTAAYWMFTGMAPMLYMEGMNVSLKHYGYYQGSLSLVFAIVCLLSPQIFKLFGQKQCFYFGMIICFISGILLLGLASLQIHQPITITAVLLLFSMGAVFPINILYPQALEVLPDTKGRSAGLGLSMHLLLTASLIELVAYFYHGQFLPIGLMMFVSIMLSVVLVRSAMKQQWLTIP